MAKSILAYLDRYRITVLGLSLGLLFFTASLTPSLIPRPVLMQGALGGFLMALGYLTGVILIGIWRFLAIPESKGAGRAAFSLLMILGSLAVLTRALVTARDNQNDVRGLMNMELLEESHIALCSRSRLAFFPAFLPRASPDDDNAVEKQPRPSFSFSYRRNDRMAWSPA